MKILRIVSRVIIGFAFMFSGFVKAVDPLGSAYKFQDYFQAFHISFLSDLGLLFAILLCTAEFMAGFSVLTGTFRKTGIWMVAVLMVIFTPLTFILALTNPVSDCGCFGDAIHLTNWQTFGKNIILGAFTLVLLFSREKAPIIRRKEWVATITVISLFLAFIFYNLRYLPVIDFLPYKKGVNITEKMSIPGNAVSDSYLTTFIYEKDGMKKEFNLTDYPANDSSWKFIQQKSVLIKKGYTPPIHDFVVSLNGEDITSRLLADKGYTVLMISKKLSGASEKHLMQGFGFGKYCMNKGIGFYVLTASGSKETEQYQNILTTICSADETTLKTIMRANPGYLLLSGGTILGKWSWAGLPEKEWFGKLIEK